MAAAVIQLAELRGRLESTMTMMGSMLRQIDQCIAASAASDVSPIDKDDPRDKNLSIDDVAKYTGISEPTIRRKIKAGAFPAGTRISAGRVAWAYRDIEPHILQYQKKQKGVRHG